VSQRSSADRRSRTKAGFAVAAIVVVAIGALSIGLLSARPSTDLARLCDAVDLDSLGELGLSEQPPSKRTYRETSLNGQVSHVCAPSVVINNAAPGSGRSALFTVVVMPYSDRAAAERDYDRFREVAGGATDVAGPGERTYLGYETSSAAGRPLAMVKLATLRGRHQLWVMLSAPASGGWSRDTLTDALVPVAAHLLDGLPD
jgi:hypothetical protein